MTRYALLRTATITLALTLAACTTTPDPAPTPTPTPTGPWPAADIAPLSPPDLAPNDLESTTAVQVVRETWRVVAWADLTYDSHFAQFTQWIDPTTTPPVVGINDEITEQVNEYPWVSIGPDPWVPVSVTQNPDGTTTVRACLAPQRVIEVSKVDGTPRDTGSGLTQFTDITLSPLTAAEIAPLEAQGLTPPPLWVRGYHYFNGDCDTTGVVVQQFENWRDVAPIGDYPLTDPTLVRVPGEDEPRRMQDMP